MTGGPISSTVQAWELGLRLREHRDRLGLTAAFVGRTTGMGSTNLSAAESGKRRLTAARLAELASLYELPGGELTELERLRADTERREWWHDHAHLHPDELVRMFGLEAGAERVAEFAPDIVPGLLQTADYARAVMCAGTPYTRPVDVGPRLETRLARQARLDGDHPLKVDVLLGEAALRQRIGGPGVMRGQLAHLLGVVAGKGDRVRLRVVPFTAGAHPLLGAGAFRAHETLAQHTSTALVRKVNDIRNGPFSGRPVDFVMTTGDNTDNHELVELDWFLTVLNGGRITADTGDAGRYEGVQDSGVASYWNPHRTTPDDYKAKGFPVVPGLLDAARRPFDSPGLRIPWYSTFGNHDDSVVGSLPDGIPFI
ncbi:Scr1 family TA system antitoxin-like transcriptional regulator, partial [Saccharothrix sp. MB29]|nr:Scr1 family TA system antitoxin-like transcriptional regulator [Saccharothrix sp. MB29]